MQLCHRAVFECSKEDPVLLVEFSSKYEAILCRNDLKTAICDVKTGENKTAILKKDLHATDVDLMPAVLDASGRKRLGDILLVGTADGKCILIHKSGKVERTLDCHRGAVLSCKWNHDGTNFISCGEDGVLKIWSRSGMLRSTVASISTPIYSAAWGPSSSSVVYTAGKALVTQSITQASKQTQWKAHDGVILQVIWCSSCSKIASSGEDCKIKLWDPQGQMLISTPSLLHPVSSLAFSRDGLYLAGAAFSSVMLINTLTGIYKLTSVPEGGISCLNWGHGGSQLAVGDTSGKLQIFNLIGMTQKWKHYEITLVSPKSMKVIDILHDVAEVVEYQEDVIKSSFKFGYLLAFCGSQIFIHKESNWLNPVSVNLRETNADLIVQTEKLFVVMDNVLCLCFSYEGSQLTSLKLQNPRSSTLTTASVAVSNDLLAVVNQSDTRVVNLWDTKSGRPFDRPLIHSSSIASVQLDPSRLAAGLAFVDNGRDLYIIKLNPTVTKNSAPVKIGSGITSFMWNVDCCMLALTKQDELSILLYPPAYVQENGTCHECVYRISLVEYGTGVVVDSFYADHVILRRGDVHFTLPLPGCYSRLQQHVAQSQWDRALRLCSAEKVKSLWACLAAMATAARNFDAAEASYAAICEPDKVLLVRSIRNTKNSSIAKAEVALLLNNRIEAESILLQAGLTFRAIMLNVHLFQFERALDLAVKYNNAIDIVIGYRQRYLENLGASESITRFLEYGRQVDVDWDSIEERIVRDFEEEPLLPNL